MHAKSNPSAASKSQRKSQTSTRRSLTTARKTKSQSKHASPLTSQHRAMSAKKLTVILNKDFEELGKAGDLVALKPGRARNHLIPKGIVSYDTAENRAALSARGVKITNVVIDKEAELKAASTRPYSVVLGDVIRNIRWNFTRHTVSSADNHIAVPITSRDILMRLRKSKFHFVTEADIVLTPGYEETGLNHCGVYPVAVALHCIDQSDWAIFDVTINRAESKQKLELADGKATV